MDQQIFTLIGTLLGASVGLFAPLVSARLTAKASHRDSQRAIADSIMGIFDDGKSPIELLGRDENPERRKLYLLAMRLHSRKAQQACLEFIAHTSHSGVDADAALEAWEHLIVEVARIYTRDH